jgi:TIR domain/CHAT domain
MSEAQPTTTILILAANPKGTVPLRLDEEVREIKAGLRGSRDRDRFEVVYESAARPGDVQQAMLEHTPQVVHFCGHGEGIEGLVLEDDGGKPKRVSAEALAELFALFAQQVNCVVLNACFSDVQAKAIAQHIPYVIGMNQEIGDRAAMKFAVSFYKGLGAGKEIEFAFNLGRNAMQMEGMAADRIPVLMRKPLAEAGDVGRSRLFISYKRGVEPDEAVAMAVYRALSADHEVFIDQTMTVGTRWAERIEAEIRRSDFLITFLSAHSVHSEMVRGEVETAHRLGQEQGRPTILPVRLAYQEAFAYPLSAFLNGIHWATWENAADTDGLVEALRRAIAGLPGADGEGEPIVAGRTEAQADGGLPFPFPAAQLEPPEGTMEGWGGVRNDWAAGGDDYD